jgi:hypothetical protein
MTRGSLDGMDAKLLIGLAVLAVACGGARVSPPGPEMDPAARQQLETAQAAAARANAQPADEALGRAAFDAAAVVYERHTDFTRILANPERQAWPQIRPVVKRVFGAAQDCPTKLKALGMYITADGDRNEAIVGYLSPRVQDCLTLDQLDDIVGYVIGGPSVHRDLCAGALTVAGALWRNAPRGSTPPSADFVGVALTSKQTSILELVYTCAGDTSPASAAPWLDPSDFAEFLRWKQDSFHKQERRHDAQNAADDCDAACLQAYGEPDGSCRVACRKLGGDSSCFRKCADDGAACSARCSQ